MKEKQGVYKHIQAFDLFLEPPCSSSNVFLDPWSIKFYKLSVSRAVTGSISMQVSIGILAFLTFNTELETSSLRKAKHLAHQNIQMENCLQTSSKALKFESQLSSMFKKKENKKKKK